MTRSVLKAYKGIADLKTDDPVDIGRQRMLTDSMTAIVAQLNAAVGTLRHVTAQPPPEKSRDDLRAAADRLESAVWVVIWRVKFSIIQNVAGLLGLFLIVFAISVFALQPNWDDLLHQATAPTIPEKESAATEHNPPTPPVLGLIVRPRPGSSFWVMNVPTPARLRRSPRCCGGGTAVHFSPRGRTSPG